MNKINYSGNSESIRKAVDDANYILNDEEFLVAITKKRSFDNTKVSGVIVSMLIRISNIKAEIGLYKPLPIPPWNRANAYTEPNSPTTIFLNKRKLRNQSVESIASTIIHEYVHLIDFATEKYDLGHGSYSITGKANTIPYWIDQLAYEMLIGIETRMVF